MRYSEIDNIGMIPSSYLQLYIESIGWDLHFEDESQRVFYKKDSPYSQIIIPKDRNSKDYNYAIAEAINIIAEIINKTVVEVYNNLLNLSYDVIRFPIDDISAISLGSLASIISEIKKLFIYSIWSMYEPKNYYINKPSNEISNRIKETKVGYTEKGSYVIPILLPISIDSVLDKIPTPRKIANHFIKTINNISIASKKAFDDDDYSYFINNINSGINANICDALASIHKETNSNIKIVSTLSPIIIDNFIKHESVILEKKYNNILSEASEKLKECEEIDFNESGYVIKLECLPEGTEGTVTMNFLSESGLKKVKFDLDRERYNNVAVEAHHSASKIAISGKLIQKGNTLKINNITNIEIIENS